NDSGQVVGWATPGGIRQAFLCDHGTRRALDRLQEARGISNSGWVVGSSWDARRSVRRALLYRNGTVKDLGTLGGSDGEAFAINDAGQIVGSASTRYNWFSHAFLWSEDKIYDLGTLDGNCSQAYGI